MGKNAKLKEKEKWSHKKLYIDNARRLRGICFIDPEDKETIKNALKNMETPVAPAMSCKIMKIVGVMHPTKSKQNSRVFWKPVNLQDCVWENHCRTIMKTILHEKETIHYSIIIWYTKFPMPQAFKIPTAKTVVDKEWETWRNFGVEPDESQK